MKEMKDLNKWKEIHIHALKNSMHAIGIGKKEYCYRYMGKNR